jgi:hypothetical protein
MGRSQWLATVYEGASWGSSAWQTGSHIREGRLEWTDAFNLLPFASYGMSSQGVKAFLATAEDVNDRLRDWGRMVVKASDNWESAFRSGADPLYRKYGAAVDNFSEEFEKSYDELNSAGVKVDFDRPGQLAYSPSLTPGEPGKFIFDLDGSIGALRHEMRHWRDDFESGYPGLTAYLKDRNLFWELEYRGYMEEISFARSQRDFESAREILDLMKKRKQEIFGK